jgi:hypothetical protein
MEIVWVAKNLRIATLLFIYRELRGQREMGLYGRRSPGDEGEADVFMLAYGSIHLA